MPGLGPLKALYEHVKSLADWADEQPGASTLTEDWDKTVYVCWNGSLSAATPILHGTSMQQVIDSAHRANYKEWKAEADGWKRRNVFSDGRNLRGGQMVVDIANPTTAAVSQSRDWKRVYESIGPSLLFQLFTRYSIFYALENSCFHQLSGVGAGSIPTRPLNKDAKRGPADVRFDRGPICYRQRTDPRLFGWPPNHALITGSDETRSVEECANALLRVIFPRAYGEESVFDQSKAVPAPRKPPKLLRQRALPLMIDMLKKTAATDIRPALFRFCPSRLPSHELDEEEQEAIVHLVTQEPFATHATEGATQAATRFFRKRDAKQKEHQPCFLDFSCPHYQVIRFLHAVIRHIVPRQLFGSEDNLAHLSRFVESLIQAKKLDVVSLQALVDGFKLTDCRWLCPLGRDGRVARLAQAEMLERTMLMEEFLYWVIDGLVMPLLRFNFFVTESSATRNQLHYFRCDDWATMCKPVLDQLKAKLYEKVDTLPASALGTSIIRLLPKEKGMRPIANLGHRKPIEGQMRKEPSINDKLAESRVVLAHEQKKQPEILGSSIYTPNDIVPPLLKLKRHLRPVLGSVPLYFVKIDVRASFDTIRQDRLLAVMRELIEPEGSYILAKRNELTLRQGLVFRQYGLQSVLDQEQEALFTDNVLELAATKRRKIFVDKGGTTSLSGEQLLAMLEKLVHETYIKVGAEFYQQKVGIPQGSCISGILCSLFYAHLDKHVLGSLLQYSDNLLARLLDDFLFISPREVDAEQFLTAMLQQAAPYGAEVAREKSVVNFELPRNRIYDGITQVPLTSDFAWCGFTLDQKLDVRVDYVRQETTNMADTVSASSGRHPGKHFMGRFYTMARSMMFRVAFDPKLNSLHSIRISIYQGFQVLAMRMYAYSTKHLSAKRGVLLTNRYRLLVQGAERLITSSKGGFQLPKRIASQQAVFLGVSAFERVWQRKGREGQMLIAELKKVITLRRKERLLWAGRSRDVLAAPSNAALDRLRF